MKKLLILIILFINCLAFGQINVGPVEDVKIKKEKFDRSDLERLKKTKTIFVYRTSDTNNFEFFKAALKKAWTYTELEFRSIDEMNSEPDESVEYSFFSIGSLEKVAEHKDMNDGSIMAVNNSFKYLHLWMMKGSEKITFCRIELYPSLNSFKFENMPANGIENYFYNETTIYNWFQGYIKNALQFVNQRIENAEELWLYSSEIYTDISILKTDTLLIPDYVLIKFDKFTGDESEKHDPEKLLKKYQFPYKFISAKELSEKIMSTEKPIYYLTYIKSSTDKFVSVTNGLNGEMLYSEYSGISYNIDSKDLKKLSDSIGN